MYTPTNLAGFVVDRALEDRAAPLESSWLDPACGDGAFLLEVLRRLSLRVPRNELPSTVEACLFGMDIDPVACARARASVVEFVSSASGPQEPDYFATNVVQGDFLSADHPLGTRFDLVVGNPPYVGATQLLATEKELYLERFVTAWGRLDLYTLFFEQGLALLDKGGRLAYITPDKFLTAASSRRLRALMTNQFAVRSIDRFERHDLFGGVATIPCVTVVDRPSSRVAPPATVKHRSWDVGPNGHPSARSDLAAIEMAKDGRPWHPPSVARGRRPTVPLGTLVERISAGLATGLNRCFVVSAELAAGLEPGLVHLAARGRDIAEGGIVDPGLRLVLPYEFDERGRRTGLVDLDDFPAVRAHLIAHRTALEQRHCVRVWSKRWYAIHDPVTMDLTSRPKIVFPDLAPEPRFAFDPGKFAPLHSAYYLLPHTEGVIRSEALTAMLNSPTMKAEFYRRAPTAKSGFRRFRAQFLRDLPVPLLTRSEEERLVEDASSGAGEFDERVAWSIARDAA